MPENTQLATTTKKGVITYTPLGESNDITISKDILIKNCIEPTKSGAVPDGAHITSFMMLCRARQLNPFVQDCYLIGYDGRNGPQWSIITAKSALDKRAEMHPEFDGYETGLVIQKEDGSLEYRDGQIMLPQDNVVGAWTKVYRKDRGRPTQHEINVNAYDSGLNRWKTDLAGMLCKCVEAGGLRKAFPNTFAGLFLQEERDAERDAEFKASPAHNEPAAPTGNVMDALPPRREENPDSGVIPRPPAQHAEELQGVGVTPDDINMEESANHLEDVKQGNPYEFLKKQLRGRVPAKGIVPTLKAFGFPVNDPKDITEEMAQKVTYDEETFVATWKEVSDE